MQEKGNMMRRAAFLMLFPLITSCIGGGEENFFCDSYHFSLWIKHVVMGSLLHQPSELFGDPNCFSEGFAEEYGD